VNDFYGCSNGSFCLDYRNLTNDNLKNFFSVHHQPLSLAWTSLVKESEAQFFLVVGPGLGGTVAATTTITIKHQPHAFNNHKQQLKARINENIHTDHFFR